MKSYKLIGCIAFQRELAKQANMMNNYAQESMINQTINYLKELKSIKERKSKSEKVDNLQSP